MKLSIRSWLEISMIAIIGILIALLFVLKRPQYPIYTAQTFQQLANSATVQAATQYSASQKPMWDSLYAMGADMKAVEQLIKSGNQKLQSIGSVVAEIQGAQGGGHSDTLTKSYATFTDPEIWIRYDFSPTDKFSYKQRDHVLNIRVVESDSGNYVLIHDETANKDLTIKDATFIRYAPRKPFLASLGADLGVLYRNPGDRGVKASDLALMGILTTKSGAVEVYRGFQAKGSDWGVGVARRVW